MCNTKQIVMNEHCLQHTVKSCSCGLCCLWDCCSGGGEPWCRDLLMIYSLLALHALVLCMHICGTVLGREVITLQPTGRPSCCLLQAQEEVERPPAVRGRVWGAYDATH